MIYFKLLRFNSVQIVTDSVTLQKIIKGFTYVNSLVYMKKSPYIEPYFYSIGPLGTFKLGIIHDVIKFCKNISSDITIDPEILKKLAPIRNIEIDNNLLPVPEAKFEYRDYQKLAITKALEYGRGLIISPTASGKSLIIAGLFHNLLKFLPCEFFEYYLLIVPNRQLVDQMYDDFVQYGIDNVQKFCSGNKDTGKIITDKKIIITNRQWLETENNKNKLLKNSIKVLFIDEVHGLNPGTKVGKLVDSIKTDYRFGCTATLPTSEYCCNEVKGIIGPVIFEEIFTELRDRGYVSKLNLVSLKFKYTKQDIDKSGIYVYNDPNRDTTENFIAEKKFFYESDKNLLNILRIISQFKGNTLVLFDNLVVGKRMNELLANTIYNDRVRYVDGSIKIETRNEIQAEMEKRSDLILFAQSVTFSTGINIKNLHNIIFVFTTKALVKILQSIGRGLRLHESKDAVNVIDISSNLKYANKHFKFRQKLFLEYYEKDFDHIIELNPNINITKNDTDNINTLMIQPKIGESCEK